MALYKISTLTTATAVSATNQFEINQNGASRSATLAQIVGLVTPAAISAAPVGPVTASGLTQATSRLLGRTTAGTGAVEEISVGSNLTLTGGVLDASAPPSQKYVARSYAEYTSFSNLTTELPVDNTVPLSTEGTQILSASITPSSASNRLRIRFQGFGTVYNNNPENLLALNGAWAIFSGSTCLSAGRIIPTDNAALTAGIGLVGEVEYVPGSTSPVTITVRVGPSSSAFGIFLNGSSATHLFGGAARATLVVEEITP